MALANYSDLKAAVASWLHRSTLTSQIPDFITLAESRINRLIKLTPQETEGTLTATTGVRTIALPSGFVSPIACWLTYWLPRQPLEFRLPQDIPVINSNSVPRYWTIDGSNVAFDCPADRALTFTLRYNTKLDIATTTTNSVLTNTPDLYLYGALLESAPYIKNDSRIATWKGLFDLAVREVTTDNNANKRLAKLRTELPGAYSTRSHIITGT